ncbi:MAG: extracellular solute-binding protein [Lachnospiraceae bacterium]|nr:extracellular solute-binding protein [Lachnospiraceae bacterium]
MKKPVRNLIIIVGVIAVFALTMFLLNLRGAENYKAKYEGYDLSVGTSSTERIDSYTGYLQEHKNAAEPSAVIDVDVTSYKDSTGVSFLGAFEGRNNVIRTEDDSLVTWEVDIPESGFYNVFIEYFLPESRGVAAERELLINGKAPFQDAENIAFSRVWTDGGEKRIDNQKNEIRPTQVEIYEWQTAYFRDDMGYITEPFKFYFEKGRQTLSIKGVNEPMMISALSVKGITSEKDYAAYTAENAGRPDNAPKGFSAIIEGEDSTKRSEPSIYAKYDKASATTSPYSVTTTILNYIGGTSWNKSSQWIEWEIEVPADGFYNISVKGRQSFSRGAVSSRILSIDGEVPFAEAKDFGFEYDNDWIVKTLSDENGEACSIYLTAGKHTVRLEATLSGMGAILEELEDSVYRLNQVYRRLLVYIGANPDKYRDYNIDQYYPELVSAMEKESRRLYRTIDETVEYTGQKADKIATALTLADQLERFVEKPHKISTEFTSFKDNVTSLGTAILDMSQTSLDVDYIVVSSAGTKIDRARANIFQKAWHGIKSFVATFIVDYDAVGNTYDAKKEEVLTVWIATGRDQGSILKMMIDDTFTPKTDIKVNVEIVDPNALLNAVVAGQGPDVVLSVASGQPVNYALRHAVEDLRQFDGIDEILGEFYPSAYTSYEFNGGVYGLPETQTYNVLFYREDILDELGLEVPQTWDDVIAMLPTIQGNNMEFGIPGPFAATAPDISVLYSILYQYGGSLYDDLGAATMISEEEGVNAFEFFTKFYTDYGMPLDFDFVSRFRSGQMPIAVTNYGSYNTLMVSAPEIRGLWDFTLIPGRKTVDENGNETIDRSVHSAGTCCMMIATDNENIKQMGWQFMKWWVGSEAQVRFGREMEALLGSSARYATANSIAFKQLSWSADAMEVLAKQREYTVGLREVAGSYYTDRHITNAVRRVINMHEDPRETILDYAITIDEELTKKRKEFGLPVYED